MSAYVPQHAPISPAQLEQIRSNAKKTVASNRRFTAAWAAQCVELCKEIDYLTAALQGLRATMENVSAHMPGESEEEVR